MPSQSEFLKFAINIAKEAGEIQRIYFGHNNTIKTKSTKIDLVSQADIESEELLINKIEAEFPNHDIIAEESDLKQKKNRF